MELINNNQVPEGYKKTEVGVIPEDWEAKLLGDIFCLKNGFSFKSEYFSSSGPIVLTPGNFNLDGGLYFNERNIKRYSGSFPESMIFKNGDLLVVMTDLTPDCNLLGKPAFVDSEETILHNQRIGKINLLSESIDQFFLYFILLSSPYLKKIKEQATGSTVRHTSNKSIYSISLPIPKTKEEQKAIAQTLSDVDALIVALDKLIAKKRNIKTATMQQLLTGKTRLQGFGGEWEVKRLGVLAKFYKGMGLSKAELTKFGKNECIHYGELFTTYCEKISIVVSKTNKEKNVFYSQKNDVLMPTSDVTPNGLATASCIKKSDVILGGDILIIRSSKEDIEGEFLAYAIKLNRNQIMQLISGTTVFHLYGRDMARFIFSIPISLPEQKAIAQVLSDMDEEITALEKRRAKTQTIKQGMMQELLTGRTRLI
jgi:type I restriction enzyme, S subunit